MRKKLRTFQYDFDPLGTFQGEGRTVAEAKEDARAKVSDAYAGSWTPIFHRFEVPGGPVLFGLLYRDLTGWGYRLFEPAEVVAGEPYRVFAMTFFRKFDEAERAMRRHAAQTLFSHDGPAGSEVITNEDDRKEHLSWCRWQRSYRAARARASATKKRGGSREAHLRLLPEARGGGRRRDDPRLRGVHGRPSRP